VNNRLPAPGSHFIEEVTVNMLVRQTVIADGHAVSHTTPELSRSPLYESAVGV
jgi:hypothetical protein